MEQNKKRRKINKILYILMFLIALFLFISNYINLFNYSQDVDSINGQIDIRDTKMGYFEYDSNEILSLSLWGKIIMIFLCVNIVLIITMFLVNPKREIIFLKHEISRLFFLPIIFFSIVFTIIMLCDIPYKYHVINDIGGSYTTYANFFNIYKLNNLLLFEGVFTKIGIVSLFIYTLAGLWVCKAGIVYLYELHDKFGKNLNPVEKNIKYNSEFYLYTNKKNTLLLVFDIGVNLLICVFTYFWIVSDHIFYNNWFEKNPDNILTVLVFFICFWGIVFCSSFYFIWYVNKNKGSKNWYKNISILMIIFGGIFTTIAGGKTLSVYYNSSATKTR